VSFRLRGAVTSEVDDDDDDLEEEKEGGDADDGEDGDGDDEDDEDGENGEDREEEDALLVLRSNSLAKVEENVAAVSAGVEVPPANVPASSKSANSPPFGRSSRATTAKLSVKATSTHPIPSDAYSSCSSFSVREMDSCCSFSFT
jgi:hypothetical protein